MNDLHHTLNTMGLQSLELSEPDQQQITRLIDTQTRFFAKVVQQKPDKPPHDLVLGLLTKSYQEALANFQATEATISRVQSVFEETIGREQAQKFTTSSNNDVQHFAVLWFMAQGYIGIDFSYANDHANEAATILAGSPAVRDNDPNALRSWFMQSYYVGRHTAKTNQQERSGLVSRIKRLFNSKRSHS
ncbi:hypothetical protein [Photobacterium atrarenae]|uniref:Uncharacterized protein n=1 Tax=Photobacterium atrarenae TaxID=865757 RepID=A0ABY5GPC4_9GAMM|nr:hypothetical protein [Photobacterium atrarenae]UTV30402.1 hypothetical protein NNL38_17650 [Photobacterium atrarenae]